MDVLVATPSCHEVSSVRHPDDDFDVESAVDSHLQAIARAVQESRPEVFVVEQSSGLYTHHRDLFDRFDAGLRSLAYDVIFFDCDAHRDFGSSHYRRRLLWLGRVHPNCAPHSLPSSPLLSSGGG